MMVDVIIVNYRSADALRKATPAILMLRDYGARFYVADNSPGDGAWEIVSHVAGHASRVLMNGNLGFAAAVNAAARQGSGEMILLLNPDISRIEGSIERVLDLFDADRCLAAAGVRMISEDGRLQPSCQYAPQRFGFVAEKLGLVAWIGGSLFRRRVMSFSYNELREVESACGGFLFIRRAAFEQVGQFDDRFFMYYEETDWLARARSLGWRVLFTPIVEVVHGGNLSSGEPSPSSSLLLLESQLKYTRKHFGAMTDIVERTVIGCIDVARWIRSWFVGTAGPSIRADVAGRLRVYVTGRAPHGS